MKPVILAGNYGSGKTELSLNLAVDYSQKGNTVLVDLDIVNPYFRSAEHEKMLSSHNVSLIAPTFANTTVDVPVISAEIKRAWLSDYAVFDCGGDPVGAAALGSISEDFTGMHNIDFFYVVNARRPLQRNAGEIIKMMDQIASRARIPFTGIVNNTNIARDTTCEDLAFGRSICDEVSSSTGIRTAFSSGEKSIVEEYEKLTGDTDTYVISVYTRPYWLDSTC